jgi:hypothetical protein
VKYTRHVLVGLTLLLAGCGGGGGGSVAVPGSPVATPTTAPTSTPTTSPSSWKNTAKVTLSWRLPATKASVKARKPQYVSPSSASLSITIASVNGGAVPSWAAPGTFSFALSTSTNCSVNAGVETCAVTVPAPPGTVVYDFAVLDSAQNTLSETPAGGVSEPIAQGQSNVLPPVNLEAVIASVDLGGFSVLNADQPDNQSVTVTAYDADSNVIYDGGNGITYFNPFTITDPDPTGATEIIASSASCPSGTGKDTTPSSLTFSGDTGFGNTFLLCYTGLATKPFSLGLTLNGNASASFVTPANATATTTVDDITVSGTTTCNAAANCQPTDADYGQQTLLFDSTTAAAQLFSASELGWTDNPYDEILTLTLDENVADPGYCGSGAGAVATVTPVGSNGWSVSPQNDGYCEATLNESLPVAYGGTFPAHSGSSVSQVWFSVTSSSFNVNGIHRQAAGARKH